MKTFSVRQAVSTGRGIALPSLALLAVCGAFLPTIRDVEELHASIGSKLGPDSDGDGLADTAEFLIGTDPDKRDTDGDGFHDIEEVARKSDPTSGASIPSNAQLSVAMYSYEEFGFLNMHTAVYVDDGDISSLEFEFGLLVNGMPVPVAQSLLVKGSKVFLYRGLDDPNDLLLVLEMPIPDQTARQLGELHTYSKIEDSSPTPRAPDVDTSSVFEVNGTFMQATTAPASVQGGTGIVFRPLTGPAFPPPNTSGGEICWQDIEAVGANGSAVIYEIKAASCEDFDSYCDTSACTSSAGSVLELPDAGSLIGG